KKKRTNLSFKNVLEISDHHWTVVTTFRPNFTLALETIFPWIIGLLGSILSFLLFWIFHAARSHALAIEESLTRFNALVANLTEGLIFAKPNGDIQLMNKVAMKIYGLDEVPRSRNDFSEYITFRSPSGEDIHPDQRPIGRALKGEKFANYELQFINKNTGNISYLIYGGTPIYNHRRQIVLVVVTVRDITYKKKIEIELREAINARDEFVSISSHELKTPLTTLRLKAQLFKHKIDKNENALSLQEVRKFAEDTDKQVSRLNRLVEDMLDVSRIRSGKFTLEKSEVNICHLIQTVVDQIKLQFLAAGTPEPTIEHCDNVIGNWDALRIEQVINNLLTNAIRYGEGKPVTLNAKKFGDKVRIFVKDQGAGISKDKQEKIFMRFERLEEVSESSGLGLGLFLSQKIVLSHGGHIWVESDEGKGSCFIVELPLPK
ncbi:MAG: PAS domain-containing sensor histidine kinase, partial [Bacteriovoracaceae bacterium]